MRHFCYLVRLALSAVLVGWKGGKAEVDTNCI
jgi:hypothetical protein